MILHTFNSTQAFAVSGVLVQEQDHVLFMEDGVYCLLDGSMNLASNNIHMLRPDADARGLSGRISTEFLPADYGDFVQLCCDADSICNWF